MYCRLPRWRLKRGTEQVAERRNEGTEQLQIVEEPVMNGTTLVLLLIARTNFSEFSDDWHNR